MYATSLTWRSVSERTFISSTSSDESSDEDDEEACESVLETADLHPVGHANRVSVRVPERIWRRMNQVRR